MEAYFIINNIIVANRIIKVDLMEVEAEVASGYFILVVELEIHQHFIMAFHTNLILKDLAHINILLVILFLQLIITYLKVEAEACLKSQMVINTAVEAAFLIIKIIVIANQVTEVE